MPVVRVKGNYREMGIQHGKQTKKLIQRAVKHVWATFPSLLNMNKSGMSQDLAQYGQNIKRLNAGFDDEIEGLAEGVGVSHEDIVLLNSTYDILLMRGGEKAFQALLCSAFAAWGTATSDGSLVAGHNDDGARFSDQFLVLLDASPKAGYNFCEPVIPGYLGYHAVANDAGFCAFGNSLENGPVREEARIGIPIWAIFRHLAQFVSDVESAIQFLRDVDTGTVLSFLLIDRGRNAAIVHRTPQDIAVIRSKEDYLVVTNHALVDEVKPHLVMRETPSSTHFRFESMNKAVKGRLGKINERTGIEIMSTHYDASVGEENPSGNTPCRHYEYEGRLSGTCRSAVVKLGRRQLTLLVGLGNPCSAQWVEVKMKYRHTAAS
jgi:isopenicillin-N N-acyltransferase-like protein